MKRWLGALATIVSLASVFAAEELPPPDDDQPLEVEPPLLIQNSRTPDDSASHPDGNDAAGADVDVARLEADVARAKKAEAAGERLFKAGILAKVETEERALRVLRLEAKLAAAQVEIAKRKVDELKSDGSSDETFTRELQAAEALLADATEIAAAAAEAKRVGEVEAAARNVARQEKLLEMGSGRKADVNRAEEKLAELQQATK